MIASDFHSSAGDAASSLVNVGHGKTAHNRQSNGNASFSYRLAQRGGSVECAVLDRVCARLQLEGLYVPRSLVVDYYVSLKTNPFVVLTGASTAEKAVFTRVVAEALVGRNNAQYIHSAGGASWPLGTGERGYYRSVLERFDSLRLLDLFHEAAAPGNCGKAYMLCLDGLSPDELNNSFRRLLRLTPDGTWRLAMPGLAPQQQPVVPANLYLIATVDVAMRDYRFDDRVVRHAGLIDWPGNNERVVLDHQLSGGRLSQWFHSRTERADKRAASQWPMPPVGYQRVMIDSAVRDVDAAHCKLAAILGDDMGLLRPSFDLSRLLWQRGIALHAETLRELTCYVANSFDRQCQGLFNRDDVMRNAQLALDAQVTQRVLWQLPDRSDNQLWDELIAYRHSLFNSDSFGGTEFVASGSNIP